MYPHTFVFWGHSYAQAGSIAAWKDQIRKHNNNNNVHIKVFLNSLKLMGGWKGLGPPVWLAQEKGPAKSTRRTKGRDVAG